MASAADTHAQAVDAAWIDASTGAAQPPGAQLAKGRLGLVSALRWLRSSVIVSTLRVVASDKDAVRVLRSLSRLVEPTRALPGCVNCKVYLDVEDANAVLFTQEWVTRADLDRYLCSDDYRTILAAIELSAEQPEIRFDTVQEREGIELVEEARRRSQAAHGSKKPDSTS